MMESERPLTKKRAHNRFHAGSAETDVTLVSRGDEETVTVRSRSLIQPFPWTSRRHRRRRSRSRHRSSPCWRNWRTRCLKEADFFTSRSGTGFARLSSAIDPTSSFRAATCGRSIATSLSFATRFLPTFRHDCVLDGEIVIPTPHGLDFDALQLRLHPAASRVAKLAKDIPASFVAFDVLALDGRDVRALPQHERRALLERALARFDVAYSCDADDTRPCRSGGLALEIRRRGSRRRHRQERDGRRTSLASARCSR